MSRWQPDAAGRLRDAALALYAERGFERTTVAEIAERAGLTERTFFRHFADKREVLFSGAELLERQLVDRILNAPEGLSALDAVVTGVESLATFFDEARRPWSVARRAVILSSSELTERELIKRTSLVAAATAALRRRGEDPDVAALAAESGITVFHIAFERWSTDPGMTAYDEHARATLAALRATCAVTTAAERSAVAG